MSNRTKSTHKLHRKLGINIWGADNLKLNQKTPGDHGKSFADLSKRRMNQQDTDFAVQLHEKQKLRSYYVNASEKELRSIIQRNNQISGSFFNILVLLEHRLDVILYRSHFAYSMAHARQLINHKHVKVNGKYVSKIGYHIREGDVIQLSPKYTTNLISNLNTHGVHAPVPNYIEVNYNILSAIFVHSPEVEQIPYPEDLKINPQLVAEYYYR